jgi:hypothetical protein
MQRQRPFSCPTERCRDGLPPSAPASRKSRMRCAATWLFSNWSKHKAQLTRLPYWSGSTIHQRSTGHFEYGLEVRRGLTVGRRFSRRDFLTRRVPELAEAGLSSRRLTVGRLALKRSDPTMLTGIRSEIRIVRCDAPWPLHAGQKEVRSLETCSPLSQRSSDAWDCATADKGQPLTRFRQCGARSVNEPLNDGRRHLL